MGNGLWQPAPCRRGDAVERAIPLLQESARTWTRERRCVSCHHQGLGPIAMAVARERGFRVDEAMLRAQLGAVRASLASADASVNLPANTNYIDDSLMLAALGSVGDPRGLATDLEVHRLLSGQHVDGHWIPYPFRPPIEGSVIANTAWAIRGLRLFAPASREKQVDAAIGRAREWIVKQTPVDTQDFAMKLLALRWSGGRTDRVVTRDGPATGRAAARRRRMEPDQRARKRCVRDGSGARRPESSGRHASNRRRVRERTWRFSRARNNRTARGWSKHAALGGVAFPTRKADFPTASTSSSRMPARPGQRWRWFFRIATSSPLR